MFLIWSKELKTHFQNRKWNNHNRKWNYFSTFQASDQKSSFSTSFSYDPSGSKLIFKTENGIIQTGKGIISPTSWPLIKNFFYWMFLMRSKGFMIYFQNRKWNYFSYFQASNQKPLLQNFPHLTQRVQIQFLKQEMELFLQLTSFWSKHLFPNHEQTWRGWSQYAGR